MRMTNLYVLHCAALCWRSDFKYLDLHVRIVSCQSFRVTGTSVYSRGNMFEILGTPVKTCFQVMGNPIKIVSKFGSRNYLKCNCLCPRIGDKNQVDSFIWVTEIRLTHSYESQRSGWLIHMSHRDQVDWFIWVTEIRLTHSYESQRSGWLIHMSHRDQVDSFIWVTEIRLTHSYESQRSGW